MDWTNHENSHILLWFFYPMQEINVLLHYGGLLLCKPHLSTEGTTRLKPQAKEGNNEHLCLISTILWKTLHKRKRRDPNVHQLMSKHWKLSNKILKDWGWGDGSVDKVFTTKAWRLEFRSSADTLKRWVQHPSVSQHSGEQADPRSSLTSHTRQTLELNTESGEEARQNPSVNLWPAYTHAHAGTHACSQTPKKLCITYYIIIYYI